jgi:hypothetical protein
MLRKNLAIWIVIAIIAQILHLVRDARMARLSAKEMQFAAQLAYEIQSQLKAYQESHGSYPPTLSQLGMSQEQIARFAYTSTNGGYWLGYHGPHYETAARRWSSF